MSTQEVVALLEERGFRLELDADGRTPRLIGPRPLRTPSLMRVLAHHRAAIVEGLRAGSLRTCEVSNAGRAG